MVKPFMSVRKPVVFARCSSTGPACALKRLTPQNCREFLFDDVLWVQKAREEHDVFVDLMRERGVEVLLLGELLADCMTDRAARAWMLDRRVTPERSGGSFSAELRRYLEEVPAKMLAEYLVGGIAKAELPFVSNDLTAAVLDPHDFVLSPLPNQLFTRDTSCWIYGGVTLNPMHWPARRDETLNLSCIYRHHPLFRDAGFEIWYGGDEHDYGPATIEGGDVMPIGNGVVLIGMGERSSPQAVDAIARNLFAKEAAERVIACLMPKDRGTMHLDTVFTFVDRDAATIFPGINSKIKAFSLRPTDRGGIEVTPEKDFIDAVADALGIKTLRLIPTGGDDYEVEREQWDDGNNVVALEPGVVVAYDRNVYTNTMLRKAGIEVITISRLGAGPRPGRRPLHDVPAAARSALVPTIPPSFARHQCST